MTAGTGASEAARAFVRRARRWYRDRCDGCGHRYAWKGDGRYSSAHGTMHYPCWSATHWKRVADERLVVLDEVVSACGVKLHDAEVLVASRYAEAEQHNGQNLAWRVFRDIENAQKAEDRP